MATTAQAEELDYTIPDGGDFHPPRSAAEMKLDEILKQDGDIDNHDDDSNMMFYLLGRPDRNVEKDKNYRGLFTTELRDAVSKAEVEQISDCGGFYDEGGRCGFEFDPIVCAQDTPDYYLYRVEQQSLDKAVITLGFARSINDKDPYPSGIYTMVRRGKNWLIDGILCRDSYGNFNFTDMDKIKGLTAKPREP